MIPGNGYRLANDVLIECSLHLVQPIVYATLSNPVTVGPNVFALSSFGIPTYAVYVGAQLLVTDATNGNEVITLTAVSSSTVSASFVYAHAAGVVVSGATWPLQQATDPIYTQAEFLSYLSRAQNEILSQLPVVYSQSPATAVFGQIFQSSPANMVEMERVSLSTQSLTMVALTRNGTGTVTAVFPYNHGMTQGQTFTVYASSPDTSFLGAFSVASVVSLTTITYIQYGSASSATASFALFNRLYEITQEEQTMQERTWRNDTFIPPTSWFEDRAGNYKWGLNAKPQSNFPINLTYSIRDNDTLTLADGFVLPDCLVYLAKWKALEYACSKDGIWASPQRAGYCKMRVDRGIAIVQRFFEGEQGAAMGVKK